MRGLGSLAVLVSRLADFGKGWIRPGEIGRLGNSNPRRGQRCTGMPKKVPRNAYKEVWERSSTLRMERCRGVADVNPVVHRIHRRSPRFLSYLSAWTEIFFRGIGVCTSCDVRACGQGIHRIDETSGRGGHVVHLRSWLPVDHRQGIAIPPDNPCRCCRRIDRDPLWRSRQRKDQQPAGARGQYRAHIQRTSKYAIGGVSRNPSFSEMMRNGRRA